MSWIPDHVQTYCTQHTLINPTPMGDKWYGFNSLGKWVEILSLCPQCGSPLETKQLSGTDSFGNDIDDEYQACTNPNCDYTNPE